MNRKLAILIFSPLLVFVLSCKHNESIKKVSIATRGCLGECPVIAIEIDESLNYKYYGGMFADKKGYYTGKITSSLWDEINNDLIKVDYLSMDSMYHSSYDEGEVEIVIHTNSKTKHISGQLPDIPVNLRGIIKNIMETPKAVRLNKVDSLSFETRYQYPSVIKPKFPPKNLD